MALPAKEVSGFSVQGSVVLIFSLTPDSPSAEHLKPYCSRKTLAMERERKKR
jgi:hypothetical protein